MAEKDTAVALQSPSSNLLLTRVIYTGRREPIANQDLPHTPFLWQQSGPDELRERSQVFGLFISHPYSDKARLISSSEQRVRPLLQPKPFFSQILHSATLALRLPPWSLPCCIWDVSYCLLIFGSSRHIASLCPVTESCIYSATRHSPTLSSQTYLLYGHPVLMGECVPGSLQGIKEALMTLWLII
ncbi:hypothetical protein MHYP_G00177980 [Metynnis hypsauchen]